ncbi:MAG: DUF6544 family protein [Meiothermus sp.]|nr:DUF6544 family protein [Meiothermus sp.]
MQLKKSKPSSPGGRSRAASLVLALTGLVAALLLAGWAGLQVRPAPFPPYPAASALPETLPLPEGLPAPVERYYRALYGARVPLVRSAVITGRASIRPVPFLPAFPARFRFTHEAGKNYRHYIEATWFGLPVMKVNETYLDGHSRQEMPWGTVENAPKADQAANLGMWAETFSMPSVFLTDRRVRWVAVDNQTALLEVPPSTAQGGSADGSRERFVVRFDPRTHLVTAAEVMRYKTADQAAQKILWITQYLPGQTVEVYGARLPAVGSATWLDDGKPWAYFTSESVVYNADLSGYVRAKGL